MLRFRYENAHDNRIKSCKECKIFSGCSNYTHKLSADAGECMYGQFEYKHPEVTRKNVDWLIFQILRSIMLSKIGADTVTRNHMMDWIKPDSLKDHDLQNGPSVLECHAFKTALTAYANFIRERRNEYTKSKRDTTEKRMAFADSIKNTYIEAKDDEVKVYTNNSEAMLRIKEEVKKEKYSFRVIDGEEARKCLVQPMSEN